MRDFGLMLDEPQSDPIVTFNGVKLDTTGPVTFTDPVKETAPVEVAQQAPVQVVQEVTTTKVGTAEASYMLKPAAQWTWENLRDYVITEAEKKFGPQIRNPAKESGIFKGFISRHGISDAVLVAQAAFEIYQGIWRNAPIGVTRFTKGNDEYFANVILARVKG